ncbi:hypothetical protein DH2020_020655 [Rehmannia glutinosa]|uniref:STAS domain-containing protein n=1 Tax=Rehmannia glutinosa TaxID=99300 RepID=A0ABR0WIU1_REHGL
MSLPEFNIIGSSNGLLCLINTLFPESIYLYNPFTRDHLEIPNNFESRDQVVVYGFGFHPITNDYKVIKITYYTASFYHHMAGLFRGFRQNFGRQLSEVQLYSLRSNVWTNKGVVPYRLEKWSSPGVLVSGRLHWVSRWGNYYDGRLQRVIVSFDLADDSFNVIKHPGSNPGPVGRWASCHLADLNGCLTATVPCGHGAFSVWIMKEYGVNESWVNEYNIGVYYPVSMISGEFERFHIWRNMFGKKLVRVLCVLKSGELLLEYRGCGLVSYNLENGTFKEMVYPGMPRVYETMVHIAVSAIDTNGVSFFKDLRMALDKRNLELVLVNPLGEVIEKLQRADDSKELARPDCLFLTVSEAVVFLVSTIKKQSSNCV